MRTLNGQSVPNLEVPDLVNFKYGRAKNSLPPSLRNGTPIREENLLTDIPYALFAVMDAAGVIPDESPESTTSSQFLTALLSLISGGDGNWFENVALKTLTPDQVGIAHTLNSAEWDQSYIEDLVRYVLDPNTIILVDPTINEDFFIYKNAAINELSQLVSTNGDDATIIQIEQSKLKISLYTPAVGPGSLLNAAATFTFDIDGVLTMDTSLVLGERTFGGVENGELWKDDGSSEVMVKANTITYDINDHNDAYNMQGGSAAERYHLSFPEWGTATKWLFLSAVASTYPDNLYTLEEWLGVNGFVNNNWIAGTAGIQISEKHAIYDFLNHLSIAANLYLEDGKYRSKGGVSVFGLEIELDSPAGDFNFNRSDAAESVADTEFTMEEIMKLNRNVLALLGAIIVGQRASGSEVDGEIFYDSTLGKLRGRENGQISNIINNNSSLSFPYRFETSTSAPPSTGKVRYNNGTQSSATKIWVDDDTDSGSDVNQIWSNLDVGSVIYVFDDADAGNFHKWEVTGLTDFSGYTEFDITLLATSGISFINNQKLVLHVVGGGGGGGGSAELFMEATNSVSQNITGGTPMKVNYGTENFDEGSNYVPGTSTYTNGASSANASCSGRARVTTAAAGVVSIFIRHNGTDIAGSSVSVTTAATFFIDTFADIRIGNADTIEVYLQQSTGFALTVQNDSFAKFSVKKENI